MDIEENCIAAGKFKAECLGLISKAQHEKTSVVITKRGKAVARLVPYDTEDGGDQPLFGALSGSVTVSGDIVAPTGEAWDAES